MEIINSPPLSEYIIDKISDKYNVLIFKGKTIDNDMYVRLDKIYLINRRFLFVDDTGYGENYELACKNLINLFLTTDYRIRFNDLYATTIIRSIIKSCCKKYNVKVGDYYG